MPRFRLICFVRGLVPTGQPYFPIKVPSQILQAWLGNSLEEHSNGPLYAFLAARHLARCPRLRPGPQRLPKSGGAMSFEFGY